jgi:hypothetical protein
LKLHQSETKGHPAGSHRSAVRQLDIRTEILYRLRGVSDAIVDINGIGMMTEFLDRLFARTPISGQNDSRRDLHKRNIYLELDHSRIFQLDSIRSQRNVDHQSPSGRNAGLLPEGLLNRRRHHGEHPGAQAAIESFRVCYQCAVDHALPCFIE